jgi:two-component system alkaline phosphatase synthesis response regulator PhoP
MDNKDKTILIVDDDRDILKVLSANLKLEGYNTITAENGLSAFSISKENTPDLIILDLGLPDIDGIQVCKKLRDSNIGIPVIMLTARDSVSDKVLGLECGADDYIVKPFNFLELSARIKSCLRRYKKKSAHILKIKNIEIDENKREVFLNGDKLNLTKTEFELLLFLIKNMEKVCSRKEIKKNLWKDKDIYNWSRTIDVHVNHLRKKLEGHLNIETVQGIGYILKEN